MNNSNKTLNYKETWNGEYKGVKFEVVHWRLGWNYYVFIPIEQLPEWAQTIFNLRGKTIGDRKDTLYYDYYKAHIIPDLDWHCGITLYEKIRNERGNVIGYRLGCDYMHLWDENRHYDLDTIVRDTRQTIDKLWEKMPDLKLRCAWNGHYYSADQVYYTDKGVCVALENKANWERPI